MSHSPHSQNTLSRFGFKNERGDAHLARTMMISELKSLLAYVNNPSALKSHFM